MKNSGLISFRAYGVLGEKIYEIDFTRDATIIVGPNGTGKSTFLSLFYLFVTQQWSRLQDYSFERLELTHELGEVGIDFATLQTYQEASSDSTPVRRFAQRLRSEGLGDLLKKGSLNKEDRNRFSNAIGIPIDQVVPMFRYMQSEFSFSVGIQQVEETLSNFDLGTVVYLPTYRRIEKDIQTIFPDIEDRFKKSIERSGAAQREGRNFVEISGFGMSDIHALINRAVDEVKEFRRASLESAYQEYIRDIVNGRIRKYSLTNLRSMSEDDFQDFHERLNADIFTKSDQDTLSEKISKIRRKNSGQPTAEDRFLGMFVEQLIDAHTRTKVQERNLFGFIEVISRYLGPSKYAEFSAEVFRIRHANSREPEDVRLEHLSSGEKQIVALFAYLFLSKRKNMMVLIDEPELSLSVPWQKTFLPDILGNEACVGIFAVTHSPFVFDNHLKDSVVDVRRLEVDHD